MPRPSNWNHPTTSIRVPTHTIDRLLELARLLDCAESKGFVQNDFPPILVTVQEKGEKHQYLVKPEPMTIAEEARAEELADEAIQRLRNAGMRRDEAILYMMSAIAERVGDRIS
jgi:hypothetical protein